MKSAIKYCCLAVLIGVIANVIIGAPSAGWADAKIGMKASDIVARLGRPSHDQLKTKGIQIWNRGGFIRTSSLAVLYYNQDAPDTATQLMQSQVWIWQRL